MTADTLPVLTPADFTTDQEVRWCPGCGDYAVLTAVRKVFASLPHRREDHVVVSGIGCAARFPYYLETYGMHTIHGRAPAFATGVKLSRPDLHVTLISGDGDLLSIGGNQTIHLMRRNLDVTVLLCNNRIYGLTKGQTSPTSELGMQTKSTPGGSVDAPINPLALALGAGCTFVARSIDVDVKHLSEIIAHGAAHRGTAFIEVYQDCNIFNHGVWFYASQKESRPDHIVELHHGRPLLFGREKQRAIALRSGRLVEVDASADDVLLHDERSVGLACLLAGMKSPELPEPIGILYRDPDRATCEDLVHARIRAARPAGRDAVGGSTSDALVPDAAGCRALFAEGATWSVEPEPRRS